MDGVFVQEILGVAYFGHLQDWSSWAASSSTTVQAAEPAISTFARNGFGIRKARHSFTLRPCQEVLIRLIMVYAISRSSLVVVMMLVVVLVGLSV